MLPTDWMSVQGPLTAAVAGLVFAVFSALEKRVAWIESLCNVFGEGCRKTADFTIFRIPVSWWGMGYYLVLIGLLLFARPLVFWFVVIGLGLEITFLWTLLTLRAFCIFCALNAVAVAALVFFVFDPARIWPAATTALLFFLVSNYLLARENREKLTEDTEPKELAAEVDGQPIRLQEVTRPLSQRIYNLKMKIYQLKRTRLEAMIRDILLDKEARSRNCSRKQLEESIGTEAGPVDETEIEDYYRKNRRQFEDRDPDDDGLRQEIRTLLRRKKRRRKIREFADSLKDRHEIKIYLQEPNLPLAQLSVKGCPAKGPERAPVAVVEISDYLCPACRSGHQTVRKVRESYVDRVRWIFKDMPLKSHRGADLLAEAAHCAADQGQFWKFHDSLFSADGKPDPQNLDEYAARVGLDVERFRSCMENREFRSRVEANAHDAEQAGVSATPTFIINGKMRSGVPSEEEFKKIIESELEQARGA